ncbi:MAG: acyl-CoA thioesterase [Saprospiraceae bacterium]
MNKIPETKTRIRFKDCDPLGHLYNTRFIEYMLEAREDQLLEHYQLNLMEYAEQQKMAWVIIKHEMVYLQEAKRNEYVWINSSIIHFDTSDLVVEYQMWNEDKSRLKGLLWSRFKHIDLKLKKAIAHPTEIHQMLEDLLNPIQAKSMDDRIVFLLSRKTVI